MAAPAQNPTIRSDSKSAKKKKGKTQSSDNSTPAAETVPSVGVTDSNNGDGSYESPYIKELYKSIRNVNKKITNASKVDGILADNPDMSLDDLVAARKINADQKAQILKKPQLQASLSQLEEQIAQYKKFDQEYKATLAAEKASLKQTFEERYSKDLEASVAAVKAEVLAEAEEQRRGALLLISQFLRLAAVRRGDEENANVDENMALEGVLAKVYAGDEKAVQTMIKLIEGSCDASMSIDSEPLTTTFADIKTAILAQLPVSSEGPGDSAEEPAIQPTEYPVQSDPTLLTQVMTEADTPSMITAVVSEKPIDAGVPQNAGLGDGGNAAAEENWDNNNLSTSQEWVEVPRTITETENGLSATPAAPSNIQSWADDQPDSPPDASSSQSANNDGFREVQRSSRGTSLTDKETAEGMDLVAVEVRSEGTTTEDEDAELHGEAIQDLLVERSHELSDSRPCYLALRLGSHLHTCSFSFLVLQHRRRPGHGIAMPCYEG